MYPPFSVMARLLIESEREESAIEAAAEAERRVRKLLDASPEWRKPILLMNQDVPPMKMLRGKHRRHLVFKLAAGKTADALCGALTELADGEWKDAEVCFEYNPATMM